MTSDPAEQLTILSGDREEDVEDAIGITIFQFPAASIWNKDQDRGVDPAILSPTMFYGFWNWKAE